MPDAEPRPWRGDPAEIVAASDDTTGEFFRRLAELRPDWHRDALCAEFDTRLWFPTRGESSQPALDICGRCLVRRECLDEAIADPSLDHGIRGGMSAQARKAHRRAVQARTRKGGRRAST